MPTLPATQALNQSSSTEHEQNLTNKMLIDVLTPMNITSLHRRINTMHRNINHGP